MWYLDKISEETAIEFFQQARMHTEETVINLMPDLMHSWPFTNKMPKEDVFEPEGVVIHHTQSMSAWNSINLLSRNVHAAHMMIMSGAGPMKQVQNHYPLLVDLPASIFMPYDLEDYIPHSGYFSDKAFGIELRNCGILRPNEKGMEAMPYSLIEETESNFRRFGNHQKVMENNDFYWMKDQWRAKFSIDNFSNDITIWHGYIYEKLSRRQIKTLIAVLRAMNVLYPFDPAFVIPSNCLCSGQPTFPAMDWGKLRECIFASELSESDIEWINSFTVHNKISQLQEFEDLDYEDEALLAEQLDRIRWRAERDNGHTAILSGGINVKHLHMYRNILGPMGFHCADWEDTSFALRMYAISQGMGYAKQEDVMSHLMSNATMFHKTCLTPGSKL